MLWLSGIHGRDNFKADSKVLGGKSVADTLDPLIDQSYMMSAIRTEVWGTKSKVLSELTLLNHQYGEGLAKIGALLRAEY